MKEIFYRHEKKIMDLRKFSLRFMKIKGKIVLDVKNVQNFRLRRAKNPLFITIPIQNQPFRTKIAPEGREHFLEVKKSSFHEK